VHCRLALRASAALVNRYLTYFWGFANGFLARCG
jgi:hypothetical protein